MPIGPIRPAGDTLHLDEDDEIRRYIDLAKFVAMLTTRTIHFERVDRLRTDDPHEGVMDLGTATVLGRAVDAILGRDQQTRPREIARLHDERMKRTYASCWHRGPESMAMWRLYSTASGVAIVSSLRLLRESLLDDESIFAGTMEYGVTPPRDALRDPRLFAFWKRSAFEYEREARFITERPEDETREIGRDIRFDLKIAVTQVIVSPNAAPYFFSAVEAVADKWLQPGRVIRSALLDRPAVYSGLE